MSSGKYFEDYTEGEIIITNQRLMTDADIRMFIGCSDNTFPVHVDPKYCAAFPHIGRPIVQGVLVLGVADGFMATKVSSPDVPSAHYGHNKVRYIKPVYPGDAVYCKFELVNKRIKDEQFGVLTWHVTVFNQDDVAVLFHEDLIYMGRRALAETQN